MKSKYFLKAVGLTFISIIYTFLVKNVDVSAIGPEESSVGFSKLNGMFHNAFDYNSLFYAISEIFGILLLLIAGIYALIGFYQLIKKFSFKKIDKEIIILGCFYLAVIIVYVFFEKVVINYRPVLEDGLLEASYPSSHTVLALCIGFSSLLISPKYVKKNFIKLTNLITIVSIISVVLFRTISGVHWISDIIGGIIISATLLMYFYTAYDIIIKKNN